MRACPVCRRCRCCRCRRSPAATKHCRLCRPRSPLDPPPCCGATRGSGRSSCTARAWRARRRSCMRRSARSGRRSRVRPAAAQKEGLLQLSVVRVAAQGCCSVRCSANAVVSHLIFAAPPPPPCRRLGYCRGQAHSHGAAERGGRAAQAGAAATHLCVYPHVKDIIVSWFGGLLVVWQLR